MAHIHSRYSWILSYLPYVALVALALYTFYDKTQYRSLCRSLELNAWDRCSPEAEFKGPRPPLPPPPPDHPPHGDKHGPKAFSGSNNYINFPPGPLPGVEDLVVVVKTGTTETYRSLTIQLNTLLPHAPNHLIFSDHEQQIAQYHIQDALDEVSEATMSGNKDFDVYRDQKRMMALGQSPEFLDLEGGWNLDKYKNIHMMKKAWQQRPHAKWYYFMDADSYVMLSGLLDFLHELDWEDKFYIGDVYEIGGIKFAQGGTGYVISHGAMKYVMETHPDMPHEYEQMAKDSCCGDLVLGAVMRDNGIILNELAPYFCGEGTGRIGFSPDNYCHPILTMHHMRPQEISDMWNFERQYARPGRYITYQDLFEQFVWSNLNDNYTDWDGLSPIHGTPVDLPSDLLHVQEGELTDSERMDRIWNFCEDACLRMPESDCRQFQVENDKCKTFFGVVFGVQLPVSRDDRSAFRSGWVMDRVANLRSSKCEQPPRTWPKDAVVASP